MAIGFRDRLKRGEVILPYIFKKVWQDRELTKEESLAAQKKKALILSVFAEEEVSFLCEEGDHHAFEGYLHPSSLSCCMRQQWFKLINASCPITSSPEDYCRKQRIFSNGDMMHLRWMALFKFYGILTGREILIKDDKIKIVGKRDADVRIPDEGDFVVDFKSANSRSFAKMVSSGNAGDNYMAQINLYMYYAKIRKGAIIVENKDTQEAVEFPVAYDEALVSSLLDRADKITKAVAERKAPEKEYEEMNRPPCSWCSWRETCSAPTLVKRLEGNNAKDCKKQKRAKPSREVLLKRLSSKKQ